MNTKQDERLKANRNTEYNSPWRCEHCGRKAEVMNAYYMAGWSEMIGAMCVTCQIDWESAWLGGRKPEMFLHHEAVAHNRAIASEHGRTYTYEYNYFEKDDEKPIKRRKVKK